MSDILACLFSIVVLKGLLFRHYRARRPVHKDAAGKKMDPELAARPAPLECDGPGPAGAVKISTAMETSGIISAGA
jgi:hypothetical protein